MKDVVVRLEACAQLGEGNQYASTSPMESPLPDGHREDNLSDDVVAPAVSESNKVTKLKAMLAAKDAKLEVERERREAFEVQSQLEIAELKTALAAAGSNSTTIQANNITAVLKRLSIVAKTR